MGGCCSTLSARDVYTQLSARLPFQRNPHTKREARDALFQSPSAAQPHHYGGDAALPDHITIESLVEALQTSFDIHKLGGGVPAVVRTAACQAASRFGHSMHDNFKSKRQAETSAAAENATAVAESVRVLRRNLRYLLHYTVAYYWTKSVIEEITGPLPLPAPNQPMLLDIVAYRMARSKLQLELGVAMLEFPTLQKVTAHCRGVTADTVMEDTSIPLATFVEFVTSMQVFQGGLTDEDVAPPPPDVAPLPQPLPAQPAGAALDEPPPREVHVNEEVPAALPGGHDVGFTGASDVGSPDAEGDSPHRDASHAPSRTEAKTTDHSHEGAKEADGLNEAHNHNHRGSGKTNSTEQPQHPTHRSSTSVGDAETRRATDQQALLESVASSSGSHLTTAKNGEPTGAGSGDQGEVVKVVEALAATHVTSLHASSPLGPSSSVDRAERGGSSSLVPAPPSVGGAAVTSAASDHNTNPRTAAISQKFNNPLPPPPSTLELWKASRALVPLLESEDREARTALFQKMDLAKRRGSLDEMDLFKGCQQHLLLQNVFCNGGSVLSNGVAVAYAAATSRLPLDVARLGISSDSRFLVFLATLTLVLDCHFLLKRRAVLQAANRLALTRARSTSPSQLSSAATTPRRVPVAMSDEEGGSTQPQSASNLPDTTRGDDGLSPPPHKAPQRPDSSGSHTPLVDQQGGLLSIAEQNRMYHSSVGLIVVSELTDLLSAFLCGTDMSSIVETSWPWLARLPRVDLIDDSAFVERLLIDLNHQATSLCKPASGTTASVGIRVSFEKLCPALGNFVCDATYPPREAFDPEAMLVELGLAGGDVESRRKKRQLLFERCLEGDDTVDAFCGGDGEEEQQNGDGGKLPHPSSADALRCVKLSGIQRGLVAHLRLRRFTPVAAIAAAQAFVDACDFELAMLSDPFGHEAAKEDAAKDDAAKDCFVNRQLPNGLPWCRYLVRLFICTGVVAATEASRQPPLVDLDRYATVDLAEPVSMRDWSSICRVVYEPAGLRAALGADPFLVYRGLKKASDDDVTSVWAAAVWGSEKVIHSVPCISPPRHGWYRLLTARMPHGLHEADEARCHALFVRLSGGGSDAVLTAKQLIADLNDAFSLKILFPKAHTRLDGVFESLVLEGVIGSDAVPARRPSLIDETTFRSFIVFVEAALHAYFQAETILREATGEEAAEADTGLVDNIDILLMRRTRQQMIDDQEAEDAVVPPPLPGNAKSLFDVPMSKAQVQQLLEVVGFVVHDFESEFAALADGTAHAKLHHVAHFIGVLAQRHLPVKKADLWARLEPFLRRVIANEDDRKKLFVFGIEKSNPNEATVLELYRSIAKDWTLDILVGRYVMIGDLLQDAVTVATIAKYPPPKRKDVLYADTVAALAVFLYAYVDVILASEDTIREARSRRKSSTAGGAQASTQLDRAQFDLLQPVLLRHGIPIGADTTSMASVFGVLAGSDDQSCQLTAVAHWAAHAAVRVACGAADGSPTPSKSGRKSIVSQSNLSSSASPSVVRSSRNSVANPILLIAASTSDAAGDAPPTALIGASDDAQQAPTQPSVAPAGPSAEDAIAREKVKALVATRYPLAHASSPWTQLRSRLPIGTSAAQCARRSTLFAQMDVTQRKTHLTPAELLDGTQLLLNMDTLVRELEPVVFRAATAAKDSLRAYFASDVLKQPAFGGSVRSVAPQYEKSIQAALSSPNITPLEFRLVLSYLYQYAELYFMFQELRNFACRQAQATATEGTLPDAAADAVPLPPLSPDVKHITYQDFVAAQEVLRTWGYRRVPANYDDVDEFDGDVEEAEWEPLDVVFRRINGGRDGVILFSEFAVWASQEQLHVEDPTFPQL